MIEDVLGGSTELKREALGYCCILVYTHIPDIHSRRAEAVATRRRQCSQRRLNVPRSRILSKVACNGGIGTRGANGEHRTSGSHTDGSYTGTHKLSTARIEEGTISG